MKSVSLRIFGLLFLLAPLCLPAGSAAGSAGAAPPDEPHYYEPPPRRIKAERQDVEICIYGGTAAGVAAAVQAARDGRKVVLVAPEKHLGGLTTGGLSYTDFGSKESIGGIAREFYRRLGKKYGVEEEWKFEPHVAEQVLNEMLNEARVPVYYRHFLKSVRKQGSRLLSLTTERGLTVHARMFIDAGYEGDLMAQAGVDYTIGRESNSKYGETLNGSQILDKHQFGHPVSPYRVENDPSSGLLPHIETGPPPPAGTGDHRIQAYNFRLTLTQKPGNRIPFSRPAGYDPAEYVLLSRYLRHEWTWLFGKFDPIRGDKVDKNNHGPISTDYIGANYAWPEAGYAAREEIFRRHVTYQQGLFWFLANDPSVPEEARRRMNSWGLCRDEFTDTGGWPGQLYVREARRMVSDQVMTELNCRGARKAEDPVGLGSYGMDSHNCRRIVVDGRVMNEGDVQAGGNPPYPISYRSVRPRRAECENLLVPVCVSASHIAYGSIRMEPVFMILAQSCAVAADLALDRECAVQDLEYSDLGRRLVELGQVLSSPQAPRPSTGAGPIPPGSLAGIVVDDEDARKSGHWEASTVASARLVGTGYLHDAAGGRGASSIAFTPHLPHTGAYEIVILAPPNENRAPNAPVTVSVEGGDVTAVEVDMRSREGGGFHPIGTFWLPAGRRTTVLIYNRGARGYVVADGVQFLPRR